MSDGLATYALTDVDTVKTALGFPYPVPTPEGDVRVEQLINAVSLAIEHETGRLLKWREYDGTRVSGRGGKLLVFQWPITVVTSVEIDGVAQSVWMPGVVGEPGDYDVIGVGTTEDPTLGIWALSRASGWPCGVQNIAVTLAAGYGGDDTLGLLAPVPPVMEEAVIIGVREELARPTRQGIMSQGFEGQTTSYRQVALPDEAKAKLAAFRRIMIGRI